jgi:hypothetical protein
MEGMFGLISGVPVIENRLLVDRVQRRTHKKKRINKKWLKKYGYKEVPSKRIMIFDRKILTQTNAEIVVII